MREDSQLSAALAEIRTHYARLRQATAAADQGHAHYLDALQADYRARVQAIGAGFWAGMAAAGAAPEAGMPAALRWAVRPWTDAAWDAYAPSNDAPLPTALRVGSLAVEGLDDLPALVPLISSHVPGTSQAPGTFAAHPGHIFLTGPDPEAARQLLQTLLLRLIVAALPGSVRLLLADPVGAGGNLAAFLRLPALWRGDKVFARPEELERQLDALDAEIEAIIQTRLQNSYPSVVEYNAAKGELAVPYRVLALADFPAGCSERMAERLLHIARNGPRAGVYLIASLNAAFPPPRNFDLARLTDLGTVLRLTSTVGAGLAPAQGDHTAPAQGDHTGSPLRWVVPGGETVPAIADALPLVARVNAWLEAVGQAVPPPPSLDFQRIVIPEAERWLGNATDGLAAPIGFDSAGQGHDFVLGQTGSVVHHGLIGGITQSGKTNLLHVLITQLALRYPPEELELYLVDFKEGVGFQGYLTLPHARAVALESEREFGLSVLRRLHDEMEDRGRLFKEREVGSLLEYRRQTGQRLPRLLLVMDEFQLLFEQEDALTREADRLLEDLVRRGASFGFHLLLSSQSPTMAGLHGSRVYNQMGLRIALRCRAADAQAILGEGNSAVGQLEQPGEAIYNDEMGLKEHNIHIRAAFLPPPARRRYQEVIRDLATGRTYPPPASFEGRAPARLIANPALLARPDASASATAALTAWLGEPIAIRPPTAAVFERYTRSNLIILGGDDAQAAGLLLAGLLSLAAAGAGGVRFAVADFTRLDAPHAGVFGRAAAGLPHAITIAGPRQAGGLLTELLALLERRTAGADAAGPPVFFLIAGLHRWRELRSADPYGKPSEAAGQLVRLADEGPDAGIHLIAWADGPATLERIKRGCLGLCDLRVALHLSEEDSQKVVGGKAAAELTEGRGLFRHEDWELGRLEKFKPYALPTDEELAQLLDAFKRRQR
jgi:hypothetical protein